MLNYYVQTRFTLFFSELFVCYCFDWKIQIFSKPIRNLPMVSQLTLYLFTSTSARAFKLFFFFGMQFVSYFKEVAF